MGWVKHKRIKKPFLGIKGNHWYYIQTLAFQIQKKNPIFSSKKYQPYLVHRRRRTKMGRRSNKRKLEKACGDSVPYQIAVLASVLIG
jgi:adenine specific DNA methylase Mod